MKIGFMGLGNMGSAMAMNLLKAEHNLTVYNRTAQKLSLLLDQGARAAANPAEASRADVVFNYARRRSSRQKRDTRRIRNSADSLARISPYFIQHDEDPENLVGVPDGI